MPAALQFFDMSVSVTPPSGHLEPLPITLGPNRQPNDVRLMFVSASGSSASAMLEMVMNSDPPTGFTAAYARNLGQETHGVYYKRLSVGDTDDVTVNWAKPSGWQHFMLSFITVRGLSLTSNPTGGWLRLNQTGGDTTATATSVTVPGAGVMLFMAGSVPSPWGGSVVPAYSVSLGVPTDWTNLVATDKSGANFYENGTDPSIVVVGKAFSGAGSTGSVAFPTSKGTPAFTGLYTFLTPAPDVTAAIAAA